MKARGAELKWRTKGESKRPRALVKLPARVGWSAVIGSRVVGDEMAGIIFREARERIIRVGSGVVPHIFGLER